MAQFNVSLGLKESGGWTLSPYEKNFTLTKGQSAKLALCFADSGGKPLTITSYTLKLRLPLADSTVLVLTGSAVDNTKGEVEFVLSSINSNLLGVGANQNAELEAFLTATPTTVSLHPIKSSFSVIAPLFVP